MPYIDRDSRDDAARRPESAGELAYALSVAIEDYRQRKGDSFQTFADIDSATRAAVREFERKVINPYEDKKLIQNGPVFEPVDRREEREHRDRENEFHASRQ